MVASHRNVEIIISKKIGTNPLCPLAHGENSPTNKQLKYNIQFIMYIVYNEDNLHNQ